MLRNPGKSTEEIQLGGGEAGAASGLAAAADNTWHWLANKEETNSSSVSTSFPDFNKTFTDTNLLTQSPPSWLNLTIVHSSLQMMASLFLPSSLSSCGLDHDRLHCNFHLHHQCHHISIHHRWSSCDCKRNKWWQRRDRWVESTGCLSGAQFTLLPPTSATSTQKNNVFYDISELSTWAWHTFSKLWAYKQEGSLIADSWIQDHNIRWAEYL